MRIGLDRVSAVTREEKDWESEEADDFDARIDIVEASAVLCVVSRLSFSSLIISLYSPSLMLKPELVSICSPKYIL